MAKAKNGSDEAAETAGDQETPNEPVTEPATPVDPIAAPVADENPADAALKGAIAERESALKDGPVGVGFYLSNGKAPKESSNYLQSGFIMWLRTEKKNADRDRLPVKQWDELYKEYTGHKPSEGQKT